MDNNKKLASIVVIVLGVVLAIVLGVQSLNLNKGSSAPADAKTLTGTAAGKMGDVTVEVVADASKIYSLTVTAQNETPDIAKPALDQIPSAVASSGSLKVDTVSGATVTSNAILQAAANALQSGGFDPANYGFAGAAGESAAAEETTVAATEAADIPADAVTATGTGKGMEGDVTVEVTLTKDKIYKVEVTKQNETEGIGTKAVEQLPPKIVAANSTKVDAVSGATVTSNAIFEAIDEAIKSAGFDPESYKTEGGAAAKAEDAVYQTDVVVVGAGGAGMIAAITAAKAGKDVVLLESQTMVGGNSVRATGGINAAPTEYQNSNEFAEGDAVEATLKKARGDDFKDNADIQALADTVEKQYADYQAKPEGYFDSAELFELDTMIGGKGKNDISLVKTLVENSPSAVDFLDSIGAECHNVGQFGGASVKRIHRPVNAEGKTTAVGAYIVPILEKNVNSLSNITLLFSTTADEILMDKDKAVGIHATGETGNNVTVKASEVILATGGFGANLDMVVKYNPDLKGFMSTNAAGAQGQGIEMATAVGAATVDLDQIQIHPTVTAEDAHLITEGLRGDGAILVNAEGKRFTDEVSTRDKVSAAEVAQTGGYSWLVIDQEMVDASAVIQGYIKAGYTVTGEDYKALAKEMDVDPDTFEETMNAWNDCVDKKSDPEFGRTSFVKKLDKAPYYAIKVTAGIHHTMGGVKIDPEAEVLKEDGTVIPNLFAAGEVTGGVHGANRLGGNAVLDFTVFGRIAGQNAVNAIDGKELNAATANLAEKPTVEETAAETTAAETTAAETTAAETKKAA